MDVFEVEKLENPKGEIKIQENRAFSYHLHTHTYCEMTLYENYDGKITVNGNEIDVHGSAAMLVTPLDFHSISFTGDSSAKYIKIGFNSELLPDLAPDAPTVYHGAAQNPFFRSLFYEMLNEKEDAQALKLLISLAVSIMRKRGEQICEPKGSVALSALKLINESFREDITLASVAERLSVSSQHLSSVFKESFGLNFSKYLSDIRLRYARDKLANTTARATDVCYEAGFLNFSHFSRSFKREFGLSPREFRAKGKK